VSTESESRRPDTQRPQAQRIEAQRTEAQRTEAQRTEAQRTEAQRIETQRPNAHSAAGHSAHGHRPEAHSVVLDAVRSLTFAMEREQHRVADAAGIATSDMLALSHLRAGGPLSQSELAARLSMAPSSVTTLVDRLERHGLAARKADPDDRRKSLVGITDSGTALVYRVREHFAAGLRHMPEADITAIAAALTQLGAAFEAGPSTP
jgi:DNA-binding MarR family transcriptional regulator